MPKDWQVNSTMAAARKDGVHEDWQNGEKRIFIVQTIAYTGWKLVGVIPAKSFSYGIINVQLFLVLLLLLTAMTSLAVSRLVAGRISRPILRLNESVKAYEAGNVRRFTSADRQRSGILGIRFRPPTRTMKL